MRLRLMGLVWVVSPANLTAKAPRREGAKERLKKKRQGQGRRAVVNTYGINYELLK